MSVRLVDAVNSADPVAIVSALREERFELSAYSREAIALVNSLGRCLSGVMQFDNKSDSLQAEIEQLAHRHCAQLARGDPQWRTVFAMNLVGQAVIALQSSPNSLSTALAKQFILGMIRLSQDEQTRGLCSALHFPVSMLKILEVPELQLPALAVLDLAQSNQLRSEAKGEKSYRELVARVFALAINAKDSLKLKAMRAICTASGAIAVQVVLEELSRLSKENLISWCDGLIYFEVMCKNTQVDDLPPNLRQGLDISVADSETQAALIYAFRSGELSFFPQLLTAATILAFPPKDVLPAFEEGLAAGRRYKVERSGSRLLVRDFVQESIQEYLEKVLATEVAATQFARLMAIIDDAFGA